MNQTLTGLRQVHIASGEEAMRLLADCVEQYGYYHHYVSEEAVESGAAHCQYFDWDEGHEVYRPGCLVGQVMWNLGYRPLPSDEEETRDRCEDHGAQELLNMGIIAAPPEVGLIFQAAQEAQDKGAPWGIAHLAGSWAWRAYTSGHMAGVVNR